MSKRYRAEQALSSGVLGVAWDVTDLETGEYLPFLFKSTAEDVANELNSGIEDRDAYDTWTKP